MAQMLTVCLLTFSVVISAIDAQTTRKPWTTYKPPTTDRRPTRKDWSSYNFPDPQVDYTACGLSKPGWVCDPGRILTSYEMDDLNGIIERIHRLAECDCPNCNATKLPTAEVLPAVAIVPQITGDHYTSDEKMAAVKDFGRSLREEHWNYGGGCDNDFVITLAVKERKVWTTVGVKAQVEGMEPHCVTEAFTNNKGLFRDGDYGDGLQLMMDDFRKILSGYALCEKEELSGGTWVGIAVGVLAAIGAGVAAVCCCCCRGHCGGCDCEGGGGGGGTSYSSHHHPHHHHYHHDHYSGSSGWGGGGGCDSGGGGGGGGGEETGGDGGGGGF